ncbi:MAG: hypothetical protein H6727_12885 [Myxococcales bacterium]|nr:hypothetical protein [Myxococcales bacterium]
MSFFTHFSRRLGVLCVLAFSLSLSSQTFSQPKSPKKRTFEEIWRAYVWEAQKSVHPQWKRDTNDWHHKGQTKFFRRVAVLAEKRLAPHQTELREHIKTLLSKIPSLPTDLEKAYTQKTPKNAPHPYLLDIENLPLGLGLKNRKNAGLLLAMRFFNPVSVLAYVHRTITSREVPTSVFAKRIMIENLAPSTVYLRSNPKDIQTVTIAIVSYFEYTEATLELKKQGYYTPTKFRRLLRP